MREQPVTSENVLKMINTLKEMQYQAGRKGALDLKAVTVDTEIKCIAGWYLTAKALNDGDLAEAMRQDKVWYLDGARMMAFDLGIEQGAASLEQWAEAFPQYWGNNMGSVLFQSPLAYGRDVDEELTFRGVIAHWYGVYRRLKNAGY